MAFSLNSFSKRKSPEAIKQARTSARSYESAKEVKKLNQAKATFQRNAPTEAELEADYSPYAMELWDDSVMLPSRHLRDNYGRADDITENTRGVNSEYDMRSTTAPVRKPGGSAGGLADVVARHQYELEHIAAFATDADRVRYEVLFDADDAEADDAPIVTVERAAMAEQLERVNGRSTCEKHLHDVGSKYSADSSLDFAASGRLGLPAAVHTRSRKAY